MLLLRSRITLRYYLDFVTVIFTAPSLQTYVVRCAVTEQTVTQSRRQARGGGYSHTLPIRVCAAQRGRDFEAPELERGIHFRGVFQNGV